jgi:ubiquinone/menaquinone biosynthesis C-methylase UbiE
MHPSVLNWVGEVVERYGIAEHATLEVGSGIINGTIRGHFTGEYVGCDIAHGRGVDVIANAEDLSLWDDGHWPTVISTEMLEHCPRPWRAMQEMARVALNMVIVTARGYDHRGCWEVHGYPNDYYRFFHTSMRLLAEDAGLTVVELDADPDGPGWLMVCKK